MTQIEVDTDVRQQEGSGRRDLSSAQSTAEASARTSSVDDFYDTAVESQPMPLIPELLLNNLKKLAKVLVATLGNQCEVVIHDLYDLERSVVWIEGNITGRKPGAPMTDLGIEKIQRGETTDLPNYRTETADGKTLKSSSTFILSEEGEAIGAFCINWDVTTLNTAQQILDSMVQMTDDEALRETFVEDATEVIERSVDSYIVEAGKPLAFMDRADKVSLVRFLHRKGIFQLQRAVPIVAELLGVTRQTVYNYLEEAETG